MNEMIVPISDVERAAISIKNGIVYIVREARTYKENGAPCSWYANFSIEFEINDANNVAEAIIKASKLENF